ncbi:hypothetical protein [Dyella flagellata]|uniref:Uncharacterized protein n=1 Tax=Dyella flagellata TaxID=1867833 RepID=A0ABQ5XDN5_9GAMM|nr:hypothetical protein [Dyella flagellata]GLQ89427.1 hypothetical protein GCM10007898_30000 [Dyella flagellata]
MLSFNRHRSLLLTLCALALLLLASTSKVFGVQPRHSLCTQTAHASAMAVVGDDESVAEAGHDSSNDYNNGQFEDDSGVDDELVSPALVHVALVPVRSGVPVDIAPSLRPAPTAGPLRPPRAA